MSHKTSIFLKSSVFITGIAGFIGFHLALKLQQEGYTVTGCDDFNAYYSVALKQKRASILQDVGIKVQRLSLKDLKDHLDLFSSQDFLIHLAAQAGVRYSLINPAAYVTSNLEGFVDILEIVRTYPHIKCLYASSSSVYGLNQKVPFSEQDSVDNPANLYAATKKSNELMAHAYHHLFNLKLIGLRFFTVYGPFGRPDMAYFSFTKAIDAGDPIEVFNDGNMKRDFTYIDDIVDGILLAMRSNINYGIYNLGNNKPEDLMDMIHLLEHYLGKKALIHYKPLQPGDVLETYADLTKSYQHLGYTPKISLQQGLEKFINWYKEAKPY
jgi:UDP-glucuronate 4-epimerase